MNHSCLSNIGESMRLVLWIVLSFMFFFTFSCSKEEQEVQKESHNTKIKVCLALGYTGSGDNSFNDIQYNGLVKAASLYPIKLIMECLKKTRKKGF